MNKRKRKRRKTKKNRSMKRTNRKVRKNRTQKRKMKKRTNRKGGSPPPTSIFKKMVGAAKKLDKKGEKQFIEKVEKDEKSIEEHDTSYLNISNWFPRFLTAARDKNPSEVPVQQIQQKQDMDEQGKVSTELMDALVEGLNLNKQRRELLIAERSKVIEIAGDDTKDQAERINRIEELLHREGGTDPLPITKAVAVGPPT